MIDFGETKKIAAVAYLARDDMENGRVKDYEIFFSSEGKQWGTPAVSGSSENYSDDVQEAALAHPATARFMKFVVKSETNGNGFAAIAELDIVPTK